MARTRQRSLFSSWRIGCTRSESSSESYRRSAHGRSARHSFGSGAGDRDEALTSIVCSFSKTIRAVGPMTFLDGRQGRDASFGRSTRARNSKSGAPKHLPENSELLESV